MVSMALFPPRPDDTPLSDTLSVVPSILWKTIQAEAAGGRGSSRHHWPRRRSGRRPRASAQEHERLGLPDHFRPDLDEVADFAGTDELHVELDRDADFRLVVSQAAMPRARSPNVISMPPWTTLIRLAVGSARKPKARPCSSRFRQIGPTRSRNPASGRGSHPAFAGRR